MLPWERAVEVIEARGRTGRDRALQRLEATLGADARAALELTGRCRDAGRVTVNFHPDRIAADGQSVAAGLAAHGRYRSQWVTWLSAGGRSALAGGARDRWERELFEGSYDGCDPSQVEFPIYGAFDLLHDPHGGSPRFGSCFLVLHADVDERVTFCVGDSHQGPTDIGARDEIVPILAGLAEQAAEDRLLGRRLGRRELFAVLDGHRVISGPGRELDHYVEAQIHGGVDLAVDVEAIVADPSFRDTPIERDLSLAAERYGFDLAWHGGSVLRLVHVPSDFRGPTMPALARQVAGRHDVVDAHMIGIAASAIEPAPPLPDGDPDHSPAQQLKYLWHTLLAHGTDLAADPNPWSGHRG